MGNLTKNISSHEVRCKCGECEVEIQDHEEVLEIVQDVCNHIAAQERVEKVVLKITSGARCYNYNRKPTSEGGPASNDRSQHPRCTAIDFQIFVNGRQVPTKRIYDYLDTKYMTRLGLGLYNSFNHVDSRRVRARWDRT